MHRFGGARLLFDRHWRVRRLRNLNGLGVRVRVLHRDLEPPVFSNQDPGRDDGEAGVNAVGL